MRKEKRVRSKKVLSPASGKGSKGPSADVRTEAVEEKQAGETTVAHGRVTVEYATPDWTMYSYIGPVTGLKRTMIVNDGGLRAHIESKALLDANIKFIKDWAKLELDKFQG